MAAAHAPQQRPLRTPSGAGDTACARRCAVRGAPNDVLLGPGPSLPILRRRFPALVRTLRGYYGPLRLLDNVRVGRAACAFPHRPAAQRQSVVEVSRFSRGEFRCARQFRRFHGDGFRATAGRIAPADRDFEKFSPAGGVDQVWKTVPDKRTAKMRLEEWPSG